MEKCVLVVFAMHLLFIAASVKTARGDNACNNCNVSELGGCKYNGEFCSDAIYTKVSSHIAAIEETSLDVILFIDFITIQQRCKSSKAIKGIGLTKVRKRDNRHIVRFQFFPIGNLDVLTTEMDIQELSNKTKWTFECTENIIPVERWNVTLECPLDNNIPKSCQNMSDTGRVKMLKAINGLFNNMTSSSTIYKAELTFKSPSESLVRRSLIHVNNSHSFNWNITCETIPVTASSSPTSTTTFSRTDAQTTSTTTFSRTEAQTTSTTTFSRTEAHTLKVKECCDCEDDMVKTGALKSDDCKITGAHLAIATILSFVAGAIVMLLFLILLKHIGKSEMCRCLGTKDDNRQVKWEGTTNNASMQDYSTKPEKISSNGGLVVNAVSHPNYNDRKIYSKLSKDKRESDHVYATSQDAYEELGSRSSEKSDMHSDEHVYNAAQSTYQSLADSDTLNTNKGSEHVYIGLDKQDATHRANETFESGTDVPNNTLDKPENLFENRASATSEHNYFTLQNDNFRLSGAVDESQATAAQGTADPGTYFVLEKENADVEDNVKQTEKGDNTYFTLEKHELNTEDEAENDEEETLADDQAYFVLERSDQ